MTTNLVVQCSLCGMRFRRNDHAYADRIKRHNEWHDPKYKGSSRDSNFYKQKPAYKKRNTVMGKPEYI